MGLVAWDLVFDISQALIVPLKQSIQILISPVMHARRMVGIAMVCHGIENEREEIKQDSVD